MRDIDASRLTAATSSEAGKALLGLLHAPVLAGYDLRNSRCLTVVTSDHD